MPLYLRLLVGGLLCGLGVLALILLSRDILPPRKLTFAAGIEGGGYWQVAEQYRQSLARDGITVELIATGGSEENARLLTDGKADVGILQGGTPAPADTETLGALFYEPIFMFARTELELSQIPALWTGVDVAVGAPGSGTHAAFDALARASGLEDGTLTPVPLGGLDAVEALIEGKVDAAFFVAPATAPYLTPLFMSDDVELLDLDYIDALARLIPGAQVVTTPTASVMRQPAIPDRDRRLLVLVAQLAASETLHPSLVNRLVIAGHDMHGAPDAVTPAGTFPAIVPSDLPLDSYARRLLVDGPSYLHDYLPYWVVAQVVRFAILLLPLLFIVVPLLRMFPAIYRWRLRRRVFRHYRAIRLLHAKVTEADSPERLDDLERRLDVIEESLRQVKLPLAFYDYAYNAMMHTEMIRAHIHTRKQLVQARAEIQPEARAVSSGSSEASPNSSSAPVSSIS
ncbi:TAXI family TRAP transporter solute-binding subunit [Halovulum sp. GXIMD14794]